MEQHITSQVSYEKRIREMGADTLEREYVQTIARGNIPTVSYHLYLIRKCYKQITGEDIRTIISKTS